MKTYTDEVTPVDSVTEVFGGANWPEREVCAEYKITAGYLAMFL